MNAEEYLVNELQKYQCICYYPSSGADLSDVDYFGSGKKLWSERVEGIAPKEQTPAVISPEDDPDLFIHTDLNFYQEFEAGMEMESEDRSLHGSCEVISFREFPAIKEPNQICKNFAFSGRIFEYKLRIWGSEKVRTLIYLLSENEYFAAKLLLPNAVKIRFIWSRNWFGWNTYGTWLANVMHQLQTSKLYSDWLCVPGKPGEPSNRAVAEKYPELMQSPKIKLVRNENIRWIDESEHGWVEEFDVKPA
jgi:hypothetical protein